MKKEDIICAEDIFGPNLGSLRGNTTRKKPEKVILNTLNNLPSGLLAEHGDVTIAIDVMYINKFPFMMTTCQAIHFGTAEMIKNKAKSTILKSIQQIINTYHGRGFKIRNVLGDRQFEYIRKNMEAQGINLNITAEMNIYPK